MIWADLHKWVDVSVERQRRVLSKVTARLITLTGAKYMLIDFSIHCRARTAWHR